MPLDEGEALARAVQQLRRACGDVSSATAELGTPRDAIAREKLRKSRVLATQCEEKATRILSSQTGIELAGLRGQYNAVKGEFDVINKEATRKEKQTWRFSTQTETTGRNDGSITAHETIRVQDFKTIDLSEFHTEEALQREKLLGVREIESNMLDLKTTYQEFHGLVHQQQTGLDTITGNVTESRTYVEKGTGEIKHASRRQKCGRKMICTVAIILVIVIIVVVVVVVVLKR